MLRGVGYSESGKREYVFRFNKYGIKTAHYIESRYAVPIFIDNNAKIVTTEKVSYQKDPKNNEAFKTLFNELKRLITQGNLARCH